MPESKPVTQAWPASSSCPLSIAAGTLHSGPRPGWKEVPLHPLPPFLRPQREESSLLSGCEALEKSGVFHGK